MSLSLGLAASSSPMNSITSTFLWLNIGSGTLIPCLRILFRFLNSFLTQMLTSSLCLLERPENLGSPSMYFARPLKTAFVVWKIFTAMGPLGCVAGLGLHARFGKLFGGALDGALIALTAGTFVYVGATEVVPEEFEDGGASKAKVLALLLGVATILGLARVADLLEARAG